MTFAVPMNLDAERDVLGVLLCDPAKVAEVEGYLRAIDFVDTRHQLIFAAIGGLVRDAQVVTAASVFERIKTQDDFTSLGGIEYLVILADRAPLALKVDGLAKVVADVSLRRRAYVIGQTIMQQASFGTEPAEAVIAQGEGALGEALRGGGAADAWQDGTHMCDAVDDVIAGRGEPVYVLTGVADFDRALGGLQDARMNIMAARPGMGKSAMAAIIALNMARAGRGVGCFSLEMDARELGLRTACAAAYRHGEDDNPVYFDILKNRMPEPARIRLSAAARELRELPLFFDQRPGLRPQQIGPAAKRLVRRWERAGIKPGCIVVDHLMKVKPDRESGNKVVDMGEVSGYFDVLARETQLPVLALAQLSRAVDARGVVDKDPQLSDLGWSGALEQDAAQVTFIVRPSEYLKTPPDNVKDVEMAEYYRLKDYWNNRAKLCNEKNRLGPSHLKIEIGLSVAHNAAWEVVQP